MKKIGFIGLGVMGLPMCRHLIQAGYETTVWNRTASRMQEPLSLGANAAHSPKEVAEKSEAIITMLGDSCDVEKIALGPSGIVEGAKPGLILIDMSSISP
ncbi:MAG TPA: NAD(P)-binding domain-containing protein, partial [Candidatus Bathyarchaeia archaeon]|nr:NAD(P)-binding domain-containing protein [Candidatus Bathyarchaeia archaeon]